MQKLKNQNITASYLVLLKEGKILLLLRQNTGYEDGNYSFVAGHVEKGESFTKAAIREAYEEAGITVDEKDLRVAHIMHRKSKDSERVDVFFMVDRWEGKIENKEPSKCLELSWHPIENLPQNVIPYIRKVIAHLQENIQYSELGWN